MTDANELSVTNLTSFQKIIVTSFQKIIMDELRGLTYLERRHRDRGWHLQGETSSAWRARGPKGRIITTATVMALLKVGLVQITAQRGDVLPNGDRVCAQRKTIWVLETSRWLRAHLALCVDRERAKKEQDESARDRMLDVGDPLEIKLILENHLLVADKLLSNHTTGRCRRYRDEAQNSCVRASRESNTRAADQRGWCIACRAFWHASELERDLGELLKEAEGQ